MKIYLVGGAVRDTLLGIPVKERDWVVVGSTPEEMIDLGYKQVGTDFPVYLHPDNKEEYALARTERKSGHGHKGFVTDAEQSITLEEDLKRRDITINAIAKAENGDLIDPYKGEEDIKNRVLRKVSNAFQEDPLRVLRVARFASQLKYLGFSIEKETLKTMKSISQSEELNTLPRERIWQETYKALKERNPEEYFKVLIQSEAIYKLVGKKFDINFKILEKISTEILEPEQRWAALAINSDYDLDVLNRVFGVPKKVQELCDILGRLIRFDLNLKPKEVRSGEVLDLIEEVDGLRRNSRFIKILKILDAYNHSVFQLKSTFIPWEVLSKQLVAVKPSSPELKDKEIAKDIRLQRLKIIDQELKKDE